MTEKTVIKKLEGKTAVITGDRDGRRWIGGEHVRNDR